MRSPVEVTQGDILQLITALGIDHEVVGGTPQGRYQVASLFAPVERGFYFFTGSDIPASIQNSVLICAPRAVPTSNNVLIRVQDDPQRVFYRLLGGLFPERSTGVISPLASIHPDARLGRNVQIDPFCVIGQCEIDDDVILGSGCHINDNTTIGARTVVEPQSVLGARGMAWVWDETGTGRCIQPQLGGVDIGADCVLGAQTVVVRGSLSERSEVGHHTLVAPGARFGHGTRVGAYCHLANNIVTAGNVRMGERCFIGSSAVFRSKVQLHPDTIVGAGSVVLRDTTAPGRTLMGAPAREHETKAQPAGMPKPRRIS